MWTVSLVMLSNIDLCFAKGTVYKHEVRTIMTRVQGETTLKHRSCAQYHYCSRRTEVLRPLFVVLT